MTDMYVAPVPPTPPAGWYLQSRGNKMRKAFLVVDPGVFFRNELDPKEWDFNILRELIGNPADDPMSSVFTREVYVVLRNMRLTELDGLGLVEALMKHTKATSCAINLATYRSRIELSAGKPQEHTLRNTLVFGANGSTRQPSAHVELFTQDFFDKDTESDLTDEEHEKRRWAAMYRQMRVFMASNGYSSNIDDVLAKGLFHQQAHSGWNTLAVVRSDGSAFSETLHSVHNVAKIS